MTHQSSNANIQGHAVPRQSILFSHNCQPIQHRKWLPRTLLSLLGIVLTSISVIWIDRPLARWLSQQIPHSVSHSQVPDLLVPAVVAITILGWLGWPLMRWLRRQRLARLLGLLGWAGPSALATKILFKWIIGRENTRTFLYFPRRYGFHWFSGGYAFQSLPSGHMTLLATLTTVFVAFYPRGKYLTWPVITILAGALVVTNYHFLGDVLAGLLLGHWLGWVLVAISQRLAPLNKPKGAYQAVSSKSTNSGSKSE